MPFRGLHVARPSAPSSSGPGRQGGATSKRPARPRLALLIDSLSYIYQKEILHGAHEEAAHAEADLLCFSGGPISLEGPAGRASIYALAQQESIDGLILTTSTMANVVGRTGARDFLRRFAPRPVCSIGVELDEVPSLLIDNVSGVRELTTHLVDVHKRRRIAMVTGPAQHAESQQRLAGYRAALAARDLPSNDELVVVGDFTHRAGVAAVDKLFDESAGCDAIVAANDWMALGVLEALDRRGLRVPKDVAVVGFDDIDEARFTAPSLTTIRQPIRELGAQAARSILRRLSGLHAPGGLTLPTSLQLRQSCGCLDGNVSGHVYPASARAQRGLRGLAEDRSEIARTLAPFLPEGGDAADDETRAELLLTALERDLVDATDIDFSSTLDVCLERTARWGNVHAWHATLTLLRGYVGAFLEPPSPACFHLERLIERAHIATSAAAERAQGRRRLDQDNLMRTLQKTTAALLAAMNVPALAKGLAENLPQIGVPCCTVALHKAGEPTEGPPLTELVLSYDGGRLTDTPALLDGADQPLPEALGARRRSMVVQPLVVGSEVLGYSTLELGPLDGLVYEVLCEQIGAAVKGIQLFRAVVDEVTKREQAERARLESEMRVATRIQTGILPKLTSASGLEIAAKMLPATEVGGDYFDVLPFDGGCWLGIGDVAGHGLPTGLVMVMIQSIVAATTRYRPDKGVGPVWAAVNNLLYDNLKRLQQDEFATLSLIRYEVGGKLSWAGAHEELIIYRAATGQCELLPLVGTWAGIRSYAPGRVPEASTSFDPGDVLLLYSDGVTEAMNADKQLFGVDRLSQALERVGTRPVDEIRDSLLATVSDWTVSQADDVTVVVVRQGQPAR